MRPTRDEKNQSIVGDCAEWIRQMRTAPTHAEADHMMDHVRSQARRRGIARQIVSHIADVTYAEVLADLGPRPKRAASATTKRMTGEDRG